MTYRTAPLELRVVGKKWKYLVRKEISIQTCILGIDVETDYYRLTPDGMLTAKVGYAYNAANHIPDSKDIMHASLWHDLIYGMIKHGHIDRIWRHYADELFRDVYIEEATRIKLESDKYPNDIDTSIAANLTRYDNWKIQSYAKLIYWGVRRFGAGSITKSEYAEEKIIII